MNAAGRERLYNGISSCLGRITGIKTRNGVKGAINNSCQLYELLHASTLRMLIWLDRLCLDAKRESVIRNRAYWDILEDCLRVSDLRGTVQAMKRIVLYTQPAGITPACAIYMHRAARMAMLIHLKCTYNLRPQPKKYALIRWAARLLYKLVN